jgi:hypothetical protein
MSKHNQHSKPCYQQARRTTMTDAISKAIEALEYAATMLDEDRYPGRITEAIAALQAMQGEAFMYGTGISQGGKHIPTKDFYQQPAAADKMARAYIKANNLRNHESMI